MLVTVFRDDGEKAMGFEATSDAAGVFKFFDLTPGDWKVLIEPPGFYPYRTTETITAGERIDTVYFIERGAYNPYDVTVTATRPRKEVSRTVITAQELDKIPGTFGDPLAVIQNFAGVARPPPFSGLVIVRGSAPEDTHVFADGTEIPLIYHFGGSADGPARRDHRLHPVLPGQLLPHVRPRHRRRHRRADQEAAAQEDRRLRRRQPVRLGRVPRGAAWRKGRHRRGRRGAATSTICSTPRSPSNAPVNLITAPRYYDYQLLANYRPAPAHDFRACFFGSDDRLERYSVTRGRLTAQLSNNSARPSPPRSIGRVWTYNFVPNDRASRTRCAVAPGRNWVDFGFGQLAFNLNTYVTQVRDTAAIQVRGLR